MWPSRPAARSSTTWARCWMTSRGAKRVVGVEVALHRSRLAYSFPPHVQRHPPIQTDDRTPRCGHRFEQHGRARSEVDDGDSGGFQVAQNRLDVGRDVHLIVVGAQLAHPGIEELYSLGASVDLSAQMASGPLRRSLPMSACQALGSVSMSCLVRA